MKMNKKFFGAVLCILVLLLVAIPTNADNLKGKEQKLRDRNLQLVKEAFEYAEDELLPLEGIAGVSYTEEPARVIVYIESEEYRATIPDKIKGIKTEIRISGKFYAMGTPLAREMLSDEKADEDVLSSDTVKLTKEQLNEVYDSLKQIKEQNLLYYILAKKALRDATTLTDDGGAILDKVLLEDKMQNYEAKLAKLNLVNQLPLSGNPRTSRVRPIVGGISCSVPWYVYLGFPAGTLGIVTLKGYILSCAHVLAMNRFNNFLLPGAPVVQPGAGDGGIFTLWCTVGRLLKYVRIDWYGYNYVDAAVAMAVVDYEWEEVLGSDDEETYWVQLHDVYNPSVGDIVRKSGRTSGVTENDVIDIHATVEVGYGWGKWAYFEDQILVDEPFIEPGDSGSIVSYETPTTLPDFVGMAFAGSSSYAIVCKASRIWDELGNYIS